MNTQNIYQRINSVREKVGYIQKDKSVSTGGGSYRAVTHDMVTATTRQAMIDAGLVSYPVLVASKMNPPLPEAKQWRYEATYDFVFVNADTPAETITIRIEAHANDNGDKAPGKALSYAKKYALLKLLDIETGEDEESRSPQWFDLDGYLVSIGKAADFDLLKSTYLEAYNAAGAAKEKDAQKVIIAAKDKRKGELSHAAGN